MCAHDSRGGLCRVFVKSRLSAAYDRGMKIAVTDSGIGGLYIVKKLLLRTQAGKIMYLADNAHAPYGALSESALRRIMRRNCTALVDAGAEAIVLGCNTATAVCIDELRALFPSVVFVGTEPAVKPAAKFSDVLTVMATPLTLRQPRFAALLAASGAKVNTPDCSVLSHLVEYGYPELSEAKAQTESILSRYPRDLLGAVVLGCTHYSYLADFIAERFGCKVFDGADGVVSRIVRNLKLSGAPEVQIALTDKSEEERYRTVAQTLLPSGTADISSL